MTCYDGIRNFLASIAPEKPREETTRFISEICGWEEEEVEEEEV